MPTARLAELMAYKGVLPYSSELLGVYSPLMGWRSERASRGITAAAAGLMKQLTRAVAVRVPPLVDARFVAEECAVEVPTIGPGPYRDGSGLAGVVMSRIRSRLPAESKYQPGIWDDALSEDRLHEVLTGPVVEKAAAVYRDLCGRSARAPRVEVAGGVRDLNAGAARRVVQAMLERESRVAGVLRELRERNMHQALHELFYPYERFPLFWPAVAAAGDPFDTIDPTSQLDRVGLSPVGIAHLFREFFFELDTFLGPPVGHIWVAPGSTVELIEVHTRRIYQEQDIEQSVETLQRTEKSLTQQDELSDAVKEDNRSGYKAGAQVTAHETVGFVGADETANFSVDSTQEKSREQVHKTTRNQSEKLTTEIKQNFKSTFRTITETTDVSTKRYVLTNATDKLINYELRRKMRQVAVQVQDVGSYLSWQTYVDEPGRQLGLSRLVHIGAPPDLSKIPQPQLIVPPPAFNENVQVNIPFIDIDGASNDDDFDNGEETSISLPVWTPFGVATDDVNHIVPDIPAGPYHCSQAAFKLAAVALDPKDTGAVISVKKDSSGKVIISGDATAGYGFVVHLDHINFQGNDSIQVSATLHWEPDVDEAAIKAENDKRIALFTAQEQAAFRTAFVTAARERIKLASNITPRKFEDLREEERVVVYRTLIQKMLEPAGLVVQPDVRTQHVVAELIDSIFDVQKLLYFAAPDYWRPRTHAHQQLGGLETITDPVSETTIEMASGDIPSQDTSAWGEADSRPDNYYITEDSTPAKLGSSLGWLLQLDGDDLRNAFLNAPWVKAVLPIRPGREKAALSWLKHVDGMGTIGPNDLYLGAEPEWQGKTIFAVLDLLAEQIAAKHQQGITTTEFPDPLDDTNTVSATPVDRVFEHGFDPLKNGFKSKPDGNFETFDQWVEILPTDQVVAVEVTYDPKTGRQM